jgi:hypothetical protein
MKPFYWARVEFPSPQGMKTETIYLPSALALAGFRSIIERQGYKVLAHSVGHLMNPQEAAKALGEAIYAANPQLEPTKGPFPVAIGAIGKIGTTLGEIAPAFTMKWSDAPDDVRSRLEECHKAGHKFAHEYASGAVVGFRAESSALASEIRRNAKDRFVRKWQLVKPGASQDWESRQ